MFPVAIAVVSVSVQHSEAIDAVDNDNRSVDTSKTSSTIVHDSFSTLWSVWLWWPDDFAAAAVVVYLHWPWSIGSSKREWLLQAKQPLRLMRQH